MSIHFEKTQRGESSVLSVYGTEVEIARLADDLKEALALRTVLKKADPKLQVPNLESTTFEDIEVLVVDEVEMLSLKRSAKRKKLWILGVWVLILGCVIWMLYLK